jgi:endonuclease/exonuclease/phosphatase family metal-dependent hydrolase
MNLRILSVMGVLAVMAVIGGWCPALAAERTGNVVKVISFNVQFLPGGASVVNKRKDPEYRARTLGDRLAAYDIIGLNEVFNDKHREILLEELHKNIGDGYNAVVHPKPADNRFNGGVAIVSRLPFIETHILTYSVGSSPKDYGFLADGFAAKGSVHARIARGKGELEKEYVDVFVTHLDSKDRKVRTIQYGELGKFIGQYSDSRHPVLIMGDMNTGGGPAEMQDPRSLYNTMVSAYQKGRPGAPIMDLWPSLNTGPGGTGNPDKPGGGGRIDYILLSNPSRGGLRLTPVTCRVNGFADPKVVTLSDHAAVEAELKWSRR